MKVHIVKAFENKGDAQAQPSAQDEALADTQRAIIEAAERRGYERAIAECSQDRKNAKPSGYAYRYPDGIRFNDGREVNGCKPTEALPYWLGAAPVAQEPVAYLDLGAGGYMDVGTDLTDEQLAALPKGRHMLAIIGTYGVDGYVAASVAAQDQADAARYRNLRQATVTENQEWIDRLMKALPGGRDPTPGEFDAAIDAAGECHA